MSANLDRVTPYVGNDGTTGQCARWNGEPSAEQRAGYVSNEWSVGNTHAPEGWREDGRGNPGGIGWTVAGFLLVLMLVVIVAFSMSSLFRGMTP
jgi:hypothetical protein